MRFGLDEGSRRVFVILSRRNLEALLAKLDGHRHGSACMIFSRDDVGRLLVVHAQENAEHYGGRGYPPAWMHPDTE